MTGPRVFTIEEVNALLPALSELVGRQMARHSEIAGRMAELVTLTDEVPPTLVEHASDSGGIKKLKGQLRLMVERYADGWNEVQELGGVVKDPQAGTVDFYGKVDGRTVWLCWRYGENSLGYYHELDAGYAGRKPLRSEVVERSLN